VVNVESDDDDDDDDDDDAGAVSGGTRGGGGSDVEWHAAERSAGCDSDEVELSGKCRVLFAMLDGAAREGERTLLFSQSLFLIDLLEKQLAQRPVTRSAARMGACSLPHTPPAV
jgi:hypothetical protein